MQLKHASLLFLIVLLGTAILTFIVIQRQDALDDQRAAVLNDIDGPIDLAAVKTPAQLVTPGSLSGNQYQSFDMDLNGDGTTESIAIAIPGNAVQGTKTELTVNASTIVFPGGNPQGYFGIVDINTADAEKEIAVSDLGPSGDPTTGFYRFDGSLLQRVGIVQGTYENIVFAGNGTLTTKTRSSIFQTWLYNDMFTLGADRKLAHVDQDVYLIDPTVPEARLTMLQDLELYTDTKMDPGTIVTTLKKGEAVTFIGCDDVAWCKAQSATGIAGWFYVEGFDTILKIDGTKVPAGEVFAGLSNAD